MRLNLLQLLFAVSLTPLTAALQTIYLAYLASSGSPHFIAFFSDSNPCTDGTLFGYTPEGFEDCNEDLTILGHQNITFTGCKPTTAFPFSLPTGVADNGAPALKCKPASNPPGGPYGDYANCAYTPSAAIVGPVSLLEFCS
ncbi:hypothetical protein HO173_008539 [Letharia columbiana]|uniref:Uncharacterized protein n=1 Tax=Letharia columbiana TaxID=112416 RepID=A0A8H6FRE8_9LECA|nr:uncharacterized protein HO173_008539 [Letharia columbiana]KAF6233250.1 hypothetical protein HO173_008539 [Letharia columbiana]